VRLDGGSGRAPPVEGSRDADELLVRELVEAEAAEFSSDPRILDAAERQVRGALDGGVDADMPTSSRLAT